MTNATTQPPRVGVRVALGARNTPGNSGATPNATAFERERNTERNSAERNTGHAHERNTPTESEAGFQDAIVEAARLMGWRAVHFRPAQTAHGWRTPGQYDAKGWPDLILTRSPRVVAIECKRQGGKLTVEQAQWLADLAACGIETHVAEPSDFDTIASVLA